MKEINQNYTSEYLNSIPEFPAQSETKFPLEARLHLYDPSTTASDLGKITGASINDIRNIYRNMQLDQDVQAIAESPYYPRRLMTRFARTVVKDWVSDPEYAHKLLRGQPVMSRTLELHATRGSCDYTCTMCLWSDKQQLTYANRQLDSFGLMANKNWQEVLTQAFDMGTRTVIFSGGGEPLLKRDIFDLIRNAREIGLKTHLYTNGFGLNRLSESDWEGLLNMEQVRVSMHSPTEEVYNQIVGLPEAAHALPRVSENIGDLLAKRKSQGGNVRVGIGFVTQPPNYNQIEQMVNFSFSLGVDFLDIRQDEVDVTRSLTQDEQDAVAKQLVNIRDRFVRGDFGTLSVDVSDDLTALANNVAQQTTTSKECFMKSLRPAISPYGIIGPCDLKVEPRFATPKVIFGNVKVRTILQLAEEMSQRNIPANCAKCMPSGRTGNAIYSKLLRDFDDGLHFTDQPFNY